jgi:3-deoxy-D-arabino-heptulosonate 7-phosphate (DAHP) synthase class II
MYQWNRRRADFNHDWLQNFYLVRLSRLLQLLDGATEDPEIERTFVTDILATWETERVEASGIIASFEELMSPSLLFEEEPLCRCDDETKRWLSTLTHSLWLSRFKIRAIVEKAAAAYTSANDAYENLQRSLVSCSNSISASALRHFRREFGEFRDRCDALSEILSLFPRDRRPL